MSLINHVLKNLEQRRSKPMYTNRPLVAARFYPRQTARLNMRFLWLGATFITSIILCYLLWTTTQNVPRKSILLKPPLPAKFIPASQVLATANIPTLTTSNLPAAPARIQAVGINGDMHNTELNIYLNKNTPYSISTDAIHNVITLSLNNTQMAEPLLPLNTSNTVIRGMQVGNSGNQFKINITLINNAQLLHIQEDQHAAPQIKLEFGLLASNVNNPVNTAPALTNDAIQPDTVGEPDTTIAGNTDNLENITDTNLSKGLQNPVEKIPQPLTPEQMADAAYEKALSLTEKNQLPQAIYLLQKILNTMPSYFVAREALTTLLIQERQFAQAETVISIGLNLQPHYPPFTQLAAQLYIAENQPERALEILQTASPGIADDPQYYAFMAALYQRLGRPAAAVKLYGELVQTQSHNALWWLGLATGLDSLGKSKAALEAYQNATSTGNLNSALQDYVDHRITALGG